MDPNRSGDRTARPGSTVIRRDVAFLTEGSIGRGLVRLSWPMLVSAILQNAQSLIDLFWVGRLGSDAVAALAMSGTILMLLFPVVMGASTGTVALVSRAAGARRYTEASEVAGQSLSLGVFAGVLMGITGWFMADDLCRWLTPAAHVASQGTAYLRVSFLGSFTVFVLFLANSALQGAGHTVIPMAALLLANAVNLALDPILIFGLLGAPAMGVRGAALATVVSQALAAGLVVFLLVRGVGRLKVEPRTWKPRPGLIWRLLRIGIPSSGQMLSRSLMALVLFRIVSSCGTAAMAAYGIGLRFHSIILMPAFALGNAAAAMVGQNLGAGQPERARRAAWLATGMDAAIMALSAMAMAPWAPALTAVFDRTPEVVAIGSSYLRIVSPFYIFAALGIVLGRALNGAGDTVATMICTVVSLWGLQVPLAVVLSRVATPSTTGIWWAISIALTANGLLIAGWFQTGRWQRQRV